ncbi:FAD binding domain-containing protein [Antricoccus suffuscus]|uniref:FAD binding domain-containing protein n=2 Tax=Antricoccus suffuscus TaxID=1629062 RepID=A0A2T1A6S4_9ACTN|nr:FAD binding domain-containing protein [Antricoccus suffuscus]
MNTGIQDGYNLAWKIALAANGQAADGLLASTSPSGDPVGEEVVGRTVRNAREGIESTKESPETVIMREAQLLVGYRGGPLAVPDDGGFDDGAPSAGERAPDAFDLTRDGVSFPVRLFEVMDSPGHRLLLYADPTVGAEQLRALESLGADTWRGELNTRLVVAPGLEPATLRMPAIVDHTGSFRAAYGARGGCWYLVRPDRYLAARSATVSGDGLAAYRAKVLRPVEE